jgi:mRNA interferase MazF
MALNLMRRGDIYLTNFSRAREAEADLVHPAVLVTNNAANADSIVVVVVPITSNIARIYPHDLELPNQRTGLNKDGKAQVNLIRHVNINRLIKRLGFVPDDLMNELDTRLREHLSL